MKIRVRSLASTCSWVTIPKSEHFGWSFTFYIIFPWFSVDLGSMHCVTGAMTQGRFGNGRGVEFTEAYKLQYWRPGMSDFILYHDSMGRSVSFVSTYNTFQKWRHYWLDSPLPHVMKCHVSATPLLLEVHAVICEWPLVTQRTSCKVMNNEKMPKGFGK